MLDILCCRITIGDADAVNPMKIINSIEIQEVHSIEITESFRKLIGSAKILFPKGTVCKSTILGPVTLEGVDASSLTTTVLEDGVIVEKRKSHSLLTEKKIHVGQRINLKLGYNGVMKNMLDRKSVV